MPQIWLKTPKEQPVELTEDAELWISWPGTPGKKLSLGDLASVMGNPEVWCKVEQQIGRRAEAAEDLRSLTEVSASDPRS